VAANCTGSVCAFGVVSTPSADPAFLFSSGLILRFFPPLIHFPVPLFVCLLFYFSILLFLLSVLSSSFCSEADVACFLSSAPPSRVFGLPVRPFSVCAFRVLCRTALPLRSFALFCPLYVCQ